VGRYRYTEGGLNSADVQLASRLARSECDLLRHRASAVALASQILSETCPVEAGLLWSSQVGCHAFMSLRLHACPPTNFQRVVDACGTAFEATVFFEGSGISYLDYST